MSKICSIIAGGKRSKISLQKDTFVIACDKGFEYAKKEGISVDLFIGDLDSFKGKLPGKTRKIVLPKEKDDTDLMSAIRYAIKEDFDVINIYCALGKRFDHELANIQAAKYAVDNKAIVSIIDDENELHFVKDKIVLPKREGWSLSVLSLTDNCKDVSIKGTKYLLKKAELSNSYPIGVSNEWESDAEISVGDGCLLVAMSKK